MFGIVSNIQAIDILHVKIMTELGKIKLRWMRIFFLKKNNTDLQAKDKTFLYIYIIHWGDKKTTVYYHI